MTNRLIRTAGLYALTLGAVGLAADRIAYDNSRYQYLSDKEITPEIKLEASRHAKQRTCFPDIETYFYLGVIALGAFAAGPRERESNL